MVIMAKRFINGQLVNHAPAGSITAYAGDTPPDGWLLCQGQELSKTEYPELYAAIGDGWNTATNPTSGAAYAAPAAGSFRLPDFRGSFLRGAGNPAQGDNTALAGYQVDKTAKNGLGLGWTSTTLNSNSVSPQITNYDGQGDWQISNSTGTSAQYRIPWVNTGIDRSERVRAASHYHSINKNSFNTNQTWAQDSETRPLNQGVNYIIRY